MEWTDRFDRVCDSVLADPELQARLRVIEDWPTFVTATVEAAADRGLMLTADDLEHARVASWETWREHWV